MKRNLIVFTNGLKETWPAIEYAAWIARESGSPLKLIGVCEPNTRRNKVEVMLERSETLMGEQVTYSVDLHVGDMDESIIQAGESNPQALILFGPYRRSSLRQWLRGDSFRNVMAGVSAPILHIPAALIPPRKILICLGGLGYALPAETLGVEIAQLSEAEVTFFHVVSPLTLDYPTTRQINAHIDDLINSDTLPGRSLRNASNLAEQSGVTHRISVRQGYILDEIRTEIRKGKYDLVCMGSTYSSHGLRHLYTPNITAEVAHSAKCAVLSARYVQDTDDVSG